MGLLMGDKEKNNSALNFHYNSPLLWWHLLFLSWPGQASGKKTWACLPGCMHPFCAHYWVGKYLGGFICCHHPRQRDLLVRGNSPRENRTRGKKSKSQWYLPGREIWEPTQILDELKVSICYSDCSVFCSVFSSRSLIRIWSAWLFSVVLSRLFFWFVLGIYLYQTFVAVLILALSSSVQSILCVCVFPPPCLDHFGRMCVGNLLKCCLLCT